MSVEVAVRCESMIGESPWWDDRTATLGWVDIDRGQVLLRDQAGIRVLTVGEQVGAAIPVDGGGLLVAVDEHLVELDSASGTALRRIVATRPPSIPAVRWNDGACDPRGRLWIGTMGLHEEHGAGSLYRWDGYELRLVLASVSISNGIAWSPDASTMYYIDSPTRTVQVYTYDVTTGELDNETMRVIDVSPFAGMPDGLCIDVEGCLWVVFYNGAAVRRFAPDGRLLAEIALPVTRPTSCAFGGDDLRSLYVTSARAGLRPDELSVQPLAGSVLVTEVSAPGLLTGRYQTVPLPTRCDPS